MPHTKDLHPSLAAFLDMTAWSEGTSNCPGSDDGYNVEVGRRLFTDYDKHPFSNGRKATCVNAKKGLFSTASGRYQIKFNIWIAYKKLLNLPDFSPESQDKIAIQLIKECHALDDIKAGRFESAVSKCRSRWASFPGSGYSQHEHAMDTLLGVYLKAGGVEA